MKKYVAKETLNKSTHQQSKPSEKADNPNPQPKTQSKANQPVPNADPKQNKKQKYQEKKQQKRKQPQVQEKKQAPKNIQSTPLEKRQQKKQQSSKKPSEKKMKYKQKNEQQNNVAKIQEEPNQTEKKEKRRRGGDRNEGKQQHQESQNFKKHVRIENKYFIHKKDVTLETPIPEAPKKILHKPDMALFNETLDKMKSQRNQTKTQINDLKRQQSMLIKNSLENKKMGYQTFNKFSGQLHEKYNNKKVRQQQVKICEAKRDETDKRLRQLQALIQILKHPKGAYEKWSTQSLIKKKKQLQHRLSVEDLTKQGQVKLKNQIDLCTRSLLTSRPQSQIYAEIRKLQDEREIEFKNLKALKNELWQKSKIAKQVRKQIKQIRQQQQAEKKELPQVKSIDQIKEQYSKKIEKLEKKNQQLHNKIQHYKDNFWKEVDLYDDQQNLLNHIRIIKERQQQIRKWEDEKEIRKKRQEEEKQRRRKQKQEEQERKKKQFEERQRKRQEKLKQEEERKKLQEEKRQKLKLEKQAYVNRNPHQIQIDLCQYLINYCESLRPENKIQTNTQEKVYKQAQQADIKGKDWDKELKKGARLITSKKNKNEEEQEKKPKKEKKKKEKQQQTNPQITFMHSGQIQNRFHKLHVLPPLNNDQINEVIKHLEDKMGIYSNPSAEEIQAYKQKASREFDLMNGIGVQKHKKVAYRQKKQGQPEMKTEKQQSKQPKKAAKVQEHQFPGLS